MMIPPEYPEISYVFSVSFVQKLLRLPITGTDSTFMNNKLCCNVNVYIGCICNRRWCRDCWYKDHTDHNPTKNNIHRYYGEPYKDASYLKWILLGVATPAHQKVILYRFIDDTHGMVRSDGDVAGVIRTLAR